MDNGQKYKSEKKCNYCKKKVVDFVDCQVCGASYHPGCAARVKVPRNSGNFSCCDTCDKSEVSVQKPRENQGNLFEMDEKKLKCIIRESFKQHLTPVEQKIDRKFEDLEKSVQYMSDSFEDQKTKFEYILKEVKSLRQENEALKQRLQFLEAKFDEIEVKEKARNIIVAGVPKQTEGDAGTIITKVLGAMKVQINGAEIENCFRMGRGDDGPILVKFKSVETKKGILKTIKQLKGITIKECGLEGKDRKIYLNEDLPLNKRNLFRRVREIKKEKGYKAALCVNGVIYLKKGEQDLAVKIRNENDLL